MDSKARSRGYQVPGQQLQGGDGGHDHHVHKIPVGDIPARKWIKAVDSKARSRGYQVPGQQRLTFQCFDCVDWPKQYKYDAGWFFFLCTVQFPKYTPSPSPCLHISKISSNMISVLR